jgi:hypothetical protein
MIDQATLNRRDLLLVGSAMLASTALPRTAASQGANVAPDMRSRLIRRPARDIIPPRGGARRGFSL